MKHKNRIVMKWKEFKKELLKDPEFKKEYEKLDLKYTLIRQLLALKRQQPSSEQIPPSMH